MKLRKLLFFAALCAIAASCEKKPIDERTEIEELEKTPVLYDQPQQKQKIDSVATDILALTDVDNWKEAFTAFYNFVEEGFNSGKYDITEFDEHLGTGSNYKEDEWIDRGPRCYIREAGEKKRERNEIVRLSDYKGAFTLDKTAKKWVYAAADKLTLKSDEGEVEISFTDYPGKVITYLRYEEQSEGWSAYTTGPAWCKNEPLPQETLNAMYDEFSRIQDHYYSGSGSDFSSTIVWYDPITYNELGKYPAFNPFTYEVGMPAGSMKRITSDVDELYMPKTASGTFSAGKGIAAISAEVDYENKNPEKKLDFSTDRFGLTSSFTFGDYTLKSTSGSFSSENGTFGYVFSKGETPIITFSFTEKGVTLSGRRVYEDSSNDQWEGGYYSWKYSSDNLALNLSEVPSEVTVSVDILGAIQVKGKVDAATLSGIMDGLSPEAGIADAQDAAAKAEECCDLGVYFDGNDLLQAELGFMADTKTIDGQTKNSVIPVIRFGDGTSYAPFEAFFNENDFASLIEKIMNWEDRVEQYFISIGLIRGKEENVQPK